MDSKAGPRFFSGKTEGRPALEPILSDGEELSERRIPPPVFFLSEPSFKRTCERIHLLYTSIPLRYYPFMGRVFFLPVETRPRNLPPLPDGFNRFWHAGIIYGDKVYECFDHGRSSISDFDECRQRELAGLGAGFLYADIDKKKLVAEINSGTSCSEYVARVVGFSKETGETKCRLPDEVYDYLRKLPDNNA